MLRQAQAGALMCCWLPLLHQVNSRLSPCKSLFAVHPHQESPWGSSSSLEGVPGLDAPSACGPRAGTDVLESPNGRRAE